MCCTGTIITRLQEQQQSMDKELEYFTMCKCEHVVTALGVGHIQCPQAVVRELDADLSAPTLQLPCMLLEHAALGSLFAFIHKVHNGRRFEPLGFTQSQTQQIIKQVALGLEHLHTRCIIHRALLVGEMPHASSAVSYHAGTAQWPRNCYGQAAIANNMSEVRCQVHWPVSVLCMLAH